MVWCITSFFLFKQKTAYEVRISDWSSDVCSSDLVVAHTRAGKQVLNLSANAEARVCVPAEGDSVAAVGENRKLLIFKRSDLPEMSRGRGVTLQRYSTGALSDAKVRSEEHTSELQSLMRISYAVFCLKKKTQLRNTKQLTND